MGRIDVAKSLHLPNHPISRTVAQSQVPVQPPLTHTRSKLALPCPFCAPLLSIPPRSLRLGTPFFILSRPFLALHPLTGWTTFFWLAFFSSLSFLIDRI